MSKKSWFSTFKKSRASDLTSNSQSKLITILQQHLKNEKQHALIIVAKRNTSPSFSKNLAKFVANSIQRKVTRIDLSTAAGKHLGESEKNLQKLFNAAETQDAILLFDEADALFGTRTDVSDAHDRFANLNTNYLIERIENYQGLAILTTNSHKKFESTLQKVNLTVIAEDDSDVEDSDDPEK